MLYNNLSEAFQKDAKFYVFDSPLAVLPNARLLSIAFAILFYPHHVTWQIEMVKTIVMPNALDNKAFSPKDWFVTVILNNIVFLGRDDINDGNGRLAAKP